MTGIYLGSIEKVKNIFERRKSMSTNGISTSVQNQRRSILVSSVALRLVFAFIISWMVILAFFVSSVVSH